MRGDGGTRIDLCLTEGSSNQFPGSGLKSRLKLGAFMGGAFLGTFYAFKKFLRRKGTPRSGAEPHI